MESTGQGCLRRHPRAPEDGAAAVQGLERAGHRAARLAGEETGARGSGAAMGADSIGMGSSRCSTRRLVEFESGQVN